MSEFRFTDGHTHYEFQRQNAAAAMAQVHGLLVMDSSIDRDRAHLEMRSDGAWHVIGSGPGLENPSLTVT